ncbi:MAG: TetR family transcriptional regulator [Acidobacteriota bacterium]
MSILIKQRPERTPADDEAGPRRRDPEATRAAILDAAEELFVDFGPNSTSLSQLARRAGVTKSLIHHHFGSKEELFAEVQQRHFRLYFEVQKQMIAESPSDARLLENSLVAYFRFLQDNPKSVRFFSWSLVAGDVCAAEPEKELFELGIRKIREAQEAGEIRDDLEPFFIIKMMIALPMSWFQTKQETLSLIDSEIEPRELDSLYLADAVRVFVDGLRPAAQRSIERRPVAAASA